MIRKLRLLPIHVFFALLLAIAVPPPAHADNIASAYTMAGNCLETMSSPGIAGAACDRTDYFSLGLLTYSTTGVALAEADYGLLRAYSQVSSIGNLSSFTAYGDARTSDSFSFDAGVASFFRIDLSFEGSYSNENFGGITNHGARGSMWGHAGRGSGLFDVYCLEISSGNGPQTCSLVVDLLPTDTYTYYQFWLESFASIEVFPPSGGNYGAGRTTADFFHTAQVTGLGLLDANGNPIDAPITAASGHVYSSLPATSVPEPSSAVLLLSAIVGLPWLASARRRGGQ